MSVSRNKHAQDQQKKSRFFHRGPTTLVRLCGLRMTAYAERCFFWYPAKGTSDMTLCGSFKR
jgi:hypothetical protein